MSAKKYFDGFVFKNGVTLLNRFPGSKNPKGLFQCPRCPKTFVTQLQLVRSGHTSSCGCFRKEVTANLGKKLYIHNLSDTKAYIALMGARRRCQVPTASQYSDYGGRGIAFNFNTIEEATIYVNQLPGSDNPKLTLDRINVDGHYEVGNLRWISRREQNLNRRGSIVYLFYHAQTNVNFCGHQCEFMEMLDKKPASTCVSKLISGKRKSPMQGWVCVGCVI